MIRDKSCTQGASCTFCQKKFVFLSRVPNLWNLRGVLVLMCKMFTNNNINFRSEVQAPLATCTCHLLKKVATMRDNHSERRDTWDLRSMKRRGSSVGVVFCFSNLLVKEKTCVLPLNSNLSVILKYRLQNIFNWTFF